jgi:hypothetical protein
MDGLSDDGNLSERYRIRGGISTYSDEMCVANLLSDDSRGSGKVKFMILI